MYKTDQNCCSRNNFTVDLLILLLRSSICVFLIATLFQIFQVVFGTIKHLFTGYSDYIAGLLSPLPPTISLCFVTGNSSTSCQKITGVAGGNKLVINSQPINRCILLLCYTILKTSVLKFTAMSSHTCWIWVTSTHCNLCYHFVCFSLGGIWGMKPLSSTLFLLVSRGIQIRLKYRFKHFIFKRRVQGQGYGV